MSVKSTYFFASTQDVNFKKHINTQKSILRKDSTVIVNFIKITSLASVTFFNTPSLYAAKDKLYNVTTFAGSGAVGSADGTGTAATFNSPGNITINYVTGNIYVADWNNYVIRQITPEGIVTTFAGTISKSGNINGTGTAAQFGATIRGISSDSSGNLYVSDYTNNVVRKITPAGVVTTFATINGPYGTAVDNTNTIYATSNVDHSIYKIQANGSSSILAGGGGGGGYVNGSGTAAKFNTPVSLKSSPSHVYVADYNNNLIRKIALSDGSSTTFAGGGSENGIIAGSTDGAGTTATFTKPTGIDIDSAGYVYVSEEGYLIRKITPAGFVTTIAGNPTSGYKDGLGTAAQFGRARDLVVDKTGAIFVADLNNNRIRKIIPNYIGIGTTDIVSSDTDYGYESITLAGGTMQVDAKSLKVGNNITFVNNTTSTLILPSTDMTLFGILSGSGALTINGGNLILTGINTFTGITTINAGAQLQFGNGGASGSIASTSIINNGMLQFGTSGTTSCTASISGTGKLLKSTSGTLTLTGTNSYTGPTTIDASSNGQTNAVLIGDISKSIGVTIASTCTYDLNGTARTLIDPSGAGIIQSSVANAALTVSTQNGSTFTGTLAGSLSGLTINGTQTFTLSSTTTYTGPVTVSSGTLALTNSTSLSGTIKLAQNATLAIKTQSTTASGTTDKTATGTTTVTNPITFGSDATGTNPTVTINVSQPTTFSGTITCNAPSGTTVTLSVTGGYPVTFTGAQTGTFKIIPSGKNTTVITPNYTLDADNSLTYTTASNASDSLSGYKNITIDLPSATNTFIFSNQKSYTGTLTIKNGTLQIGTGGTSVTVPNTNIVNNGAINFTRSSDFTYTGVISGTGTFKKSTSSKLTLTNPSTYTGATTIDAGCTIAGDIGSSVGVSIAGTYDLNGAQQTLIDPSGTGIIKSTPTSAALLLTSKNGSMFSGVIDGTVKKITVNGKNTLTLPNIATYAGPISIDSGSTLVGNISNSENVTVNGTYDLKGSALTLNNISGTGAIQNSGSAATLTVASRSDSIFSGTFASTLNRIIKNGPSTLTLSGSKPYAGEIIVSEGTLALANTTSTNGTLTLSQKATLSINTQDASTFTNAINFGSTTIDNPTATINVNKPTTFSGSIACSAPPGTTGTLIISGGYPVTLTGKHTGTFAIILSGKGTSVILQGDANVNTEVFAGSTWFTLNKEKS